MTGGCSLATSFNQDDAEKQRSTHAKLDDQAAGLKQNKALDLEAVKHIKVGMDVMYTKGQGTVVKKDGSFLTIYNKDDEKYDQVHAGEAYIPGDTISMGIMNQLWDQMAMEQRTALLSKAKISEPLHFIARAWHELPMNLREVLKLSPPSTSVGSGWANPPKGARQDPGRSKKPKVAQPGGADVGNAGSATTGQSKVTPVGNKVMTRVGGKDVQVTERQRHTWESNTNPSHREDSKFNTAYGDKLQKKPKQVDSTFVPGDKPKTEKPDKDGKKYSTSTTVGGKPLELGKAVEIYRLINHLNKIKSDLEHNALGGVVTDTPFDAPEDYEDDKRHQCSNEFQHESQKKPGNPKDGGKEVMIGFHTKDIKQGEADESVEKEGGGAVTTGTVGANNAVYNEEKELKNKYNTRYGPRQVTKSEAERFLNK